MAKDRSDIFTLKLDPQGSSFFCDVHSSRILTNFELESRCNDRGITPEMFSSMYNQSEPSKKALFAWIEISELPF